MSHPFSKDYLPVCCLCGKECEDPIELNLDGRHGLVAHEYCAEKKRQELGRDLFELMKNMTTQYANELLDKEDPQDEFEKDLNLKNLDFWWGIK